MQVAATRKKGTLVLAMTVFLVAGRFAAAQLDEPPADAALEPFDVKDCTGPAAGKTLCYYCRYELRPVVCIFTRGLDEPTRKLIAAVDEAVERHRAERMAAFVVLLGDDTGAAERGLRQLAQDQRISRTPLTIYRDTREKLVEGLGVSPEAALTVRTWRGGRIVGQRVEAATESLDVKQLVKEVEQIARPSS
jgi:hypothetical protein